ncbi:MAG: hypothetical protein AB1589_45960, partial [Cyanobacteriota bacterium]
PKRTFTLFPRSGEGQQMQIELNPEDYSWVRLSEGSEDGSDTEALKKAYKERILKILDLNAHNENLRARDIIELLGMNKEDGRVIYTVLDRMVNAELITCRMASSGKRYKVYSLPGKVSQGSEVSTPHNTSQNSPPPPSPSPSIPKTHSVPESIVNKGIDPIQQEIQHPEKSIQHLSGETSPVEFSNPSVVSNPELFNTCATKQGGGCVERVVEGLDNPTQLSQGSQQEVPDPWGIEEVESTGFGFKIYDTVAGSDPYSANYAMHGSVEDVRSGEVLVRWAEREGKPGLQTEWYSVDELRLIEGDEPL